MSPFKPIRYEPRLVVAAGLAYVTAGFLLMFVEITLMTILVEWTSHGYVTIVFSIMLITDGFCLMQVSTVKVDLILELAASGGCPIRSDVEKARLRQMSRVTNALIFVGITFCAIFSFLLTYRLEPVIATVMTNRALMVFYFVLVFFVPLVVVLISISLYTQRKYRDIRPILDAVQRGFLKEVYYRRFKEVYYGVFGMQNEEAANTEKKSPVEEAGEGQGKETGRCMVCNLPIYENEAVKECNNCKNIAHRAHLAEWIHVKGTCPVCGIKMR